MKYPIPSQIILVGKKVRIRGRTVERFKFGAVVTLGEEDDIKEDINFFRLGMRTGNQKKVVKEKNPMKAPKR